MIIKTAEKKRKEKARLLSELYVLSLLLLDFKMLDLFWPLKIIITITD